jgi:hypothetical protein
VGQPSTLIDLGGGDKAGIGSRETHIATPASESDELLTEPGQDDIDDPDFKRLLLNVARRAERCPCAR